MPPLFRAPLGLYFHVNWFTDRNKTKTLLRFIDNILAQYKDVWFVTMQELVSWMRQPTKSSSLNNFAPWACEKRENACNLPNNCPAPLMTEDGFQEMRYMQTCRKCPVKYPWIGNFEGANEGHRITELTKDGEDDAET